jgi:hypothetical protein
MTTQFVSVLQPLLSTILSATNDGADATASQTYLAQILPQLKSVLAAEQTLLEAHNQAVSSTSTVAKQASTELTALKQLLATESGRVATMTKFLANPTNVSLQGEVSTMLPGINIAMYPAAVAANQVPLMAAPAAADPTARSLPTTSQVPQQVLSVVNPSAPAIPPHTIPTQQSPAPAGTPQQVIPPATVPPVAPTPVQPALINMTEAEQAMAMQLAEQAKKIEFLTQGMSQALNLNQQMQEEAKQRARSEQLSKFRAQLETILTDGRLSDGSITNVTVNPAVKGIVMDKLSPLLADAVEKEVTLPNGTLSKMIMLADGTPLEQAVQGFVTTPAGKALFQAPTVSSGGAMIQAYTVGAANQAQSVTPQLTAQQVAALNAAAGASRPGTGPVEPVSGVGLFSQIGMLDGKGGVIANPVTVSALQKRAQEHGQVDVFMVLEDVQRAIAEDALRGVQTIYTLQ